MIKTSNRTGVLVGLYVAALAIRWAYAAMLFGLLGEKGLLLEDSSGFLDSARAFARAFADGTVNGAEWLGPSPWTMPLFQWLLVPHALFDGLMPFTYVLFQGALDAGTCLLVHRIAGAIDSRHALPAAVCAVVNPTQIVLTGIVLTDTPFVFFIALFLLGAVQWLQKPSARAAAFVAIGLSAALLIRILAAPWSTVAFLFLFVAAVWQRQLGRQEFVALLMAGIVVAASTALVLWRNVTRYDAWALTPQGGVHLALWVVPLVKEAKDRTPWAQTFQDMQVRRQDLFGAPPNNPFELSRQLEQVGRRELSSLGVAAMAKAWASGAAVNLAAPGILLSAPLYYSPRTGFYATQGSSFFAKTKNFLLASANPVYAWSLMAGLVGAGIVWIAQIAGFVTLLRAGHWLILGFFSLWCLYILAINGAVASPKYRLPLEPVLMTMAGAGIARLRRVPAARGACRA